MLRFFAKHSSGEEFEELEKPRASDVWIQGAEVTERELSILSRHLHFDASTLSDLRDEQELPRIDAIDRTLYMFLRIPRITKRGNVATSPLLAVVAQNHVYATLTQAKTTIPEDIMGLGLPFRNADPQELLVATIAAVVNEYEALVQHTERSIKEIKNRLRTHEVSNNDFVQFVATEDNLNVYHINLDGMLTMTRRLTENKARIFSAADIDALEDSALHMQQLLVAVRSYKQSVASIQNAYATIASNTLNQRMKVLTVFTILITLPNVLYGMYGMNVALPFANEPWAYGMVVGVTLVLAIIIYILAKRSRLF